MFLVFQDAAKEAVTRSTPRKTTGQPAAFSSEDYFTLYWKEIAIGLHALSIPTCSRGLHGRAH